MQPKQNPHSEHFSWIVVAASFETYQHLDVDKHIINGKYFVNTFIAGLSLAFDSNGTNLFKNRRFQTLCFGEHGRQRA